MRGVQIWRSGGVQSPVEELTARRICLFYKALSEWHFGEVASCQMTMAEAISLAKELKDMTGIRLGPLLMRGLAVLERNFAKVERLASDLIELTTRHRFCYLAGWRSRSSVVGRAALRAKSGRHRVHRRWNTRLSGNRFGAAPAIFSVTKG